MSRQFLQSKDDKDKYQVNISNTSFFNEIFFPLVFYESDSIVQLNM
jgi:hypothetical protein